MAIDGQYQQAFWKLLVTLLWHLQWGNRSTSGVSLFHLLIGNFSRYSDTKKGHLFGIPLIYCEEIYSLPSSPQTIPPHFFDGTGALIFIEPCTSIQASRSSHTHTGST